MAFPAGFVCDTFLVSSISCDALHLRDDFESSRCHIPEAGPLPQETTTPTRAILLSESDQGKSQRGPKYDRLPETIAQLVAYLVRSIPKSFFSKPHLKYEGFPLQYWNRWMTQGCQRWMDRSKIEKGGRLHRRNRNRPRMGRRGGRWWLHKEVRRKLKGQQPRRIYRCCNRPSSVSFDRLCPYSTSISIVCHPFPMFLALWMSPFISFLGIEHVVIG